ncbi:TetR family transcriptional regulator [Spirosoma sp. HMF3257]|uniref:TetR/AcrR family transcriptional regulator n=1 Tax=Spirosoma telluris TaxID=2183553 RepID=A0A327NH53_9BACT|nr:TetR family transcriptional regulator [Spirosoma telluris]RAI74133.1 TetR/AcrR family transcriptional regulator [Spirosoma telluris]
MEVTSKNRTKTTQRIIDALEDEISDMGWQGLRMNRIAEKANVSKTLIYRYFGNLDGLISHYLQLDRFFPVFTDQILAHIRPVEKSDLARIWYRQVIQTYRSFRSSKPARELLKATLFEHDPMADAISQTVDKELTRLVEQLSFIEGFDTKAISAVMLGGMSYLTIMAQNNRPVVGLDLRSEEGWKRIEDTIRLLYIAVNKLAIETDEIKLESQIDDQWS